MAFKIAGRPDCFANGLHQRSMFFKLAAIEAVAVNLITVSEVTYEFDLRVCQLLKGVRRNCLMASPPGLEPGITA